MLDPTTFIPMVRSIASRMKRRIPWGNVDVEDLVGAGMVGLVRGVRRYKKRRGRPQPFLAKRIHGAIQDHLRDCDHLSRNTRLKLRKLRRAGKSLGKMALHEGAPRGLVAEDRWIADRQSFNPAAGLELEDVLGWIRRHAGPRAALVLKLKYVDRRKTTAIAKSLGISESMVIQIIFKARRKLLAAAGAA